MSEPDRPPQPLVVTLASLTVVSGFLDAVSFLGLGHVFIANMTGNVVLVGFAAAGAPGFSVAASLCALGFFLGGAAVGGRIARRVRPHRTLMLAVMVMEAALTAAAAIVSGAVPAISAGWPRFAVIALLAFAVGVRNAAVRRLGVRDMTTTVLTTTLTGLASDSWLAGGADPHARYRLTSVFSSSPAHSSAPSSCSTSARHGRSESPPASSSARRPSSTGRPPSRSGRREHEQQDASERSRVVSPRSAFLQVDAPFRLRQRGADAAPERSAQQLEGGIGLHHAVLGELLFLQGDARQRGRRAGHRNRTGTASLRASTASAAGSRQRRDGRARRAVPPPRAPPAGRPPRESRRRPP